MGKDIDWEAIKKLNLDTSPEAEMRFNAALKRALRVPTTPEEDKALAEQARRVFRD